jgi:hypothetical protein
MIVYFKQLFLEVHSKQDEVHGTTLRVLERRNYEQNFLGPEEYAGAKPFNDSI